MHDATIAELSLVTSVSVFFQFSSAGMNYGSTQYEEEAEKVSFTPATSKLTINLGPFRIRVVWANLFFATLAVAGQVGQNVSLPLWIDSTNDPGAASNSTSPTRPSVDSYFVLSFASLSFVIIFGLGTLCIRLFRPELVGKTETKFPQKLLIAVGVCDALNGVLVVFAGSGKRIPPYLQAILGNFMIPLTLLFRYGSAVLACSS